MVKDGEVVIVDEFTGRLMPGRRWSDGLHQAVEAKEKVKIERENQTLATVTFQNYFRKYKKLSGMTGTADTEAEEFAKIYKLDVVVIPPNRRLRRVENPDLVYRTEAEKWDAIVSEIVEEHAKGRPVLVGTVSIEKSEKLSSLLDRRGLKRGTTTGGGVDKHVVLNAKYHAQEAEFVAQAGRKGAVTIATNMAGRGTDILLGGNPEFMTRQQCLAEEIAERLPKGEERFVEDEQFVYFYHIDAFYRVPKAAVRAHLRALQEAVRDRSTTRSSRSTACTSSRPSATRRGASTTSCAAAPAARAIPGASRFYLSLEDDLMRIFGSDRISGLMQKLGMEEGVPIEHGMVTRAIERAQKQVEGQNFSVRKHLLEYDDVMNKQRENIYALRREILDGKIRLGETEEDIVGTREYLMTLARRSSTRLSKPMRRAKADFEQWDLDALKQRDATASSPIDAGPLDFSDRTSDEIRDMLWERILASYDEKEKLVGREILQRIERDIMLQIVDQQWKDHLYSLDHLKEGIGLRGYGQRDPLVEYKKESFALFQDMKERIDEEIVRYLWWLRPILNEGGEAPVAARRSAGRKRR